MAQLGARLNGIQKVRGSNPLISTKILSRKKSTANAVDFFCLINDIVFCLVKLITKELFI
jgi:hypothetical protein